MVVGDLDSYVKKNETWPPTYTIHKNNFKVDKRLIYSHDIVKVTEENIVRKISGIPCSSIFINTFPNASDINERINKWNYIKLKSLYTAKGNIKKMEREPTVWKNISANDTLGKSLILKTYKAFTQLHTRKTNNPIKNGQRTWTDTSPRRTQKLTIDIWKNVQHSD